MSGLLDEISRKVSCIHGIEAIVAILPGRDSNTHEYTDLDIALYYAGAKPFQTEALRAFASSIVEEGEPAVAGLHEWGHWTNGGAHVLTGSGRVNFLYRELEQVRAVVEQACQGQCLHEHVDRPSHRYYHFYSTMYLAEIENGVVLHDPRGHIADLRYQIAVYPPRLKVSIVQQELQNSEHTLVHARELADRGDVFGTVALLARVSSQLTQTLFALNEVYFTNDESAPPMLASFHLIPLRFRARLSRALAHPGLSTRELSATVAEVITLWEEIVALTGEMYRPRILHELARRSNGSSNAHTAESSLPADRSNGHGATQENLTLDETS